MSGPVEVRDFLLQHESKDTALNFSTGGVPAQRNGDTSRVSDEQVHRAQLAVARGAQSVEDCRELLDMLGLVPGEDGIPPVRR
ncbi:hypothetical protein [Actinophytocola glycyrrhizae]|uniref:Uncharacterized protein n=1 Tax=Actinophytocola glycyrrhizae TaxID=2044873 RepID=A0ABV9SD85_9PSEU